jgi:hypothetical protein
MVPQLNATWIDGLPAGEYEVRAFTYGYVQTKADGVTFEHVTFNVPAVEWPGDIYIPFDLRLSNYIKKTVHFHDFAGTLQETGIPGDPTTVGAAREGRYLFLEALDGEDDIWAWKTLWVRAGNTRATIWTRGIRGQTSPYWTRTGMPAGDSGRNYGIVSGAYTMKAYMFGYVEQTFEKVTIGLCGTEIAISDHLYRGALFNVTFYSKDWEHPTVSKPWKYKDEYIYLQIYKDGKQLTGYGIDRKRGAQYYQPGEGLQDDNDDWTHDGLTAPYGVTGEILSGYRIKQGEYVQDRLGLNWLDPQVELVRDFATLYYEGQEPWQTTDSHIGYYPTSFESGLYEFVGMTYGYVMQNDPLTKQVKRFQVYCTKGTVADIPIKLVVGVQIPLIIRFKHENIFEHLRYNSTVRVRVFDDADALVGEWLTSGSINGTDDVHVGGVYHKALPATALPTMNPAQLRTVLGPGYTFVNPNGFIETVNYVPRSTMMLNLTICGLPDPYGCGPREFYGYQGFDRAFDVRPWTPGKYGAPGAPYGINGQPWYTGGYYVQVEVVPFGNEFAAVPFTSAVTGTTYTAGDMLDAGDYGGAWYPPVPGILYGESCAIDPRTGQLYSWCIAPNHIGPYQQRMHILLPGAHLGGESSGIMELDLLGLAQGVAYSYTWCDDWRTTSWVNVMFSGAPGAFNLYTFDGVYQAYLPAGTWKMDVIPWSPDGQGLYSQSFTLAISDGQVGGYNVYLEQSGIPIPEFSTTLIVLASALAAALSIIRRKQKR